MKARKFVLIYFETVKATQLKAKKKNTVRNKVNTRLKKMSSRQNKENHVCKTNPANSIGAGYASYFKAVFFCVRVVAVCDLEVVLTS